MFKRAITLSVASAMIWSAAQGAQTQGAVEQKVMQLEHDVAKAFASADIAVVERFEAPDYIFTGPGGSVTGRADDVNDLKTGNFKAEAIDLDDMKVHVYGDTAVVTGKVTLKNCKYRGNDLSGDYRFTDVWTKTNAGWQVIASQSSPLAKR